MPDDRELAGDSVLENRSLDVVSGDGWALLDTSRYGGRPGVYDVGARLGLTTAMMLLVVLGAAESWAAEGDGITHPEAIICREGAVLVEFEDGSAHQLNRDALWMADTRPLRRVSNVSTSIAQVLVIGRGVSSGYAEPRPRE
jgi:hypothetical protein